MRLQWCGAPAPRFGRAAARLPKALDPDNCGAGTNRKFLGRLAPRSSTFDLRNHSLPHLPRIGLWHRPASQKRINADSLSHPRPHENPPDSIGAEHALETPSKTPVEPKAAVSSTRCASCEWQPISITSSARPIPAPGMRGEKP